MPEELPDGAAGEQAQFLMWHKSAYEEYVKNMEDRHEAFLSEFTMFVSELTNDQIRVLREILESCNDSHVRAEMNGIAIGYQVFVQGRTVRGKDANEEFEAMMKREAQAPEAEAPEPEPEVVEMVDPSVEVSLKMRDYGVKPNFTEEGVRRGVECINCGLAYADLDARMESPPGVDGCKGCQSKAKWG